MHFYLKEFPDGSIYGPYCSICIDENIKKYIIISEMLGVINGRRGEK